jgi:hypothetical protein
VPAIAFAAANAATALAKKDTLASDAGQWWIDLRGEAKKGAAGAL